MCGNHRSGENWSSLSHGLNSGLLNLTVVLHGSVHELLPGCDGYNLVVDSQYTHLHCLGRVELMFCHSIFRSILWHSESRQLRTLQAAGSHQYGMGHERYLSDPTVYIS